MSKLVNDGNTRIISDMYQSKTDKKHILNNPETYTGPIKPSK